MKKNILLLSYNVAIALLMVSFLSLGANATNTTGQTTSLSNAASSSCAGKEGAELTKCQCKEAVSGNTLNSSDVTATVGPSNSTSTKSQ